MSPAERPRTVAFYLPQYHRLPENDLWWGDGFTEWTNTRRARPLFDGHAQPRVPTELGYYDLTDLDVMRRQVDMARSADVDAFCFYFYWFDGHRLLEGPVDRYRDAVLDLPYCLSWANESWTRRWDGKARDVLMPQNYEEGFADLVYADLSSHFRAPHYLRHDGRPVLLVHRVDEIPDACSVARRWRTLAAADGHPGLYLVATETKSGIDPRNFGFDAAAEFPPVGSNTLSATPRAAVADLAPAFAGRLLDYSHLAKRFMSRPGPPFVRHRGVAPGWDNTARRGPRATVYLRPSPRLYARWLRAARAAEMTERGPDGLVFVNAWNEWAEGAYLEPDQLFGDAYLRATRHDADPDHLPDSLRLPEGSWTWGHLVSAARLLAASCLSRGRRFSRRARLDRRVRAHGGLVARRRRTPFR